MRFQAEKKDQIIQYILEKIVQRQSSLAPHVATTFSISENVVYTYLRDLEKNSIIRKVKRGQYELIKKQDSFCFLRSSDQLSDDMDIYMESLEKYITDLSNNIIQVWTYAFSEMANNVIDHSDCNCLRVLISRDYLYTSVILQDDGIGIFEKIKNHFHFATLDIAIAELLKGKLTTDIKHHSGEGIFFTSRMMDQFAIISSGKVFAINKYNNDILLNYKDSKGTTLFMELSNFSKKTPMDIFNQYSDIDNGFTKTVIPLKTMFDSVPVSRSQAKRVCQRLSAFKTVEFDFYDIEWVGQGFMDQIFRVFQNQNPDIELIPSNMNTDVQKMYQHVIQG